MLIVMNATRAALRQIVSTFGYDADTVISVYMDQYEARVRYRVFNPDGTFSVQEDGFLIPDPPVPPGGSSVAVDPAPAAGAPGFSGAGLLEWA
jgi:hypothetical protein